MEGPEVWEAEQVGATGCWVEPIAPTPPGIDLKIHSEDDDVLNILDAFSF